MTFEGNFKYCTGAQCESSCCKSWSGSIDVFQHEVDELRKIVDKKRQETGHDIQVVDDPHWECTQMQNCFREGVGCILGKQRPTTCKTFPIVFTPEYPKPGDKIELTIGACPQKHLILKDEEFFSNAIAYLKTIFNLSDSEIEKFKIKAKKTRKKLESVIC